MEQTQIFIILSNIANLLGFHNLTSFFLALVFVCIALAFVSTGAVFLFKKQRERKRELEKIVDQVQKEFSKKDPEITKTNLKLDKVVKKDPETTKTNLKLDKLVKKDPETTKPKPELAEPKKEPEAKIQKPELKLAPVNLGSALSKTRMGFMKKLANFFSQNQAIKDDEFEELEEILFTADIGVKTAQKLLDRLQERAEKATNAEGKDLKLWLKEEMLNILGAGNTKKAGSNGESPKVCLFVGVNGAGKTTSIGKLGARYAQVGKKVVFGAGDTFRAAAVKQLAIWGERVGAQVISGKEKSDSASVLFETINIGKEQGADIILCDTAGRLHTKTELMDELKKVLRVAGKALSGAPHEVFLVVDATMGQNAITQARQFAQAAPLSGIVLSKLDGTAKGGMVLGIVDELGVPIRYIGVGEQIADLKEFDPKEFVDALFSEA